MNSTYTNPTPDDGNLTADRLIEAYKELQSALPPVSDTIRCNASMIDRFMRLPQTQVVPGKMSLLGMYIEVMDALPDGTMLAGRYVRDDGRLVFKTMTMYQRRDDGKWVEYDWDALMALLG